MYYARLGLVLEKNMQNLQIVCEFTQERPSCKQLVKEQIMQGVNTSYDAACGWEVPGNSDKHGDDLLAKKLLGGARLSCERRKEKVDEPEGRKEQSK
jgi:hypothetical protein